MKISLKDNFLNTISNNNMLVKGDSVLIALSGGVDSTVMTCLFNEIRNFYDLKLYAFHLNHMIRKREAKKEAEFVKGLCTDLSIKAFIREYDVKKYAKANGLSVQVAAREIRYKMLEELKKKHKIAKIATAHNADDRVETVLMRLIRGTGGYNIAGISPVRDGYIIHPLIDTFKDDIKRYAKKNKIEYMEDSSNSETKYLRNKVRSKLIPYLKKNYNKSIKDSVLNLAKVASLENDYINEKVKVKYESSLLKKSKRELTFDIKKLKQCEKAILNRIVTMAYYSLAPVGHIITYVHVERVCESLYSKRPNLSFALSGGITLIKSYEKLKLTSSDSSTFPHYAYELSIGTTTTINEAGLKVKSELVEDDNLIDLVKKKNDLDEYVDANKLTLPVTARSFKPGDTIRPLNMKGKKKLKDIFINKKVSIKDRRTLPVIVSGGEIICVIGVTFSDSFKITADTKRAVKFSLIDG